MRGRAASWLTFLGRLRELGPQESDSRESRTLNSFMISCSSLKNGSWVASSKEGGLVFMAFTLAIALANSLKLAEASSSLDSTAVPLGAGGIGTRAGGAGHCLEAKLAHNLSEVQAAKRAMRRRLARWRTAKEADARRLVGDDGLNSVFKENAAARACSTVLLVLPEEANW
eukprot:jgi/Bigna1/82436/fgenesh1_pg.92_\